MSEPAPDRNVEAVVDRLRERSRAGLAKYGVTTERGDLTLDQWLQHLQEELLDAAIYVERVKAEHVQTRCGLEAKSAAFIGDLGSRPVLGDIEGSLRQAIAAHGITFDHAQSMLFYAALRFHGEDWPKGLSNEAYRAEYAKRCGACSLWGRVANVILAGGAGGGEPPALSAERHSPLRMPEDRAALIDRACEAEDGQCSTGASGS